MIYFDNSATTYPKPECVYEALDYANRNLAFNAGRGHYEQANKASLILDSARESIASFVGGSKNDVAFTSSATEALNLIILGLSLENNDYVYVSPFEHNSIIRPLYKLSKERNIHIVELPFSHDNWEPNLNKIEEMFTINKPKAVFLSHLSNVTGLLIDYISIFDIAKKYQSITVLDAAQSFGIISPELKNVDFCVFAGHKSLYASFGIAGIISKKFNSLKVIKSGGNGTDSLNHEMPSDGYERIESGSHNVVTAYGLIESCKWLKQNNVYEKEKLLTSYLIDSLKKISRIKLYLPVNYEKRIFGIVSFNIEGYQSDEVASILFNEFEICVRSGYHCSPLVHKFLNTEEFEGTVRISIGAFNTKDEINKLVQALLSF